MGKNYPFRFVEPTVRAKRKHLISSRLEKGEAFDIQKIKLKLKELRKNSIDKVGTLIESTMSELNKYPNVKASYAQNADDASKLIFDAAGDVSNIAVNNSSVVNELMPQLKMRGNLKILDSYIHDLNIEEEEILKDAKKSYWEVPDFEESVLWHSFVDNSGQNMPFEGTKLMEGEFTGILGVNAVSSDGNIFFLQHLYNISKILSQASKVVIVVGIDKLVEKEEDALFQTRCCALFGYESILSELSLSIREGGVYKNENKGEESKHIYRNIAPPETHVIILDNGRKEVLDGDFKELLYCIGCRACIKMCPRAQTLVEGYRSAKDLLLSAFTHGIEHAVENGLYNCTLCKGCESLCPVEIPLTSFLSVLREKASSKGLFPESHRRLYDNIREYGTPYGLKALEGK